jgi:Zn-dependent protease
MRYLDDPAALAGILIALLVGLTFHEFSHAYVADQLGDHRPRALGRLSLNPIDHIDPIGAIVFFIAGFGWAKPVPVNPYALRIGRRGMAVVAAAGPIANVVTATAFAVVYRVLDIIGVGGFAADIVGNVVFFNIILAIFNLLPIPPLDGYNVVLPFLPPRTAMQVQQYAPYGIILLLVLVIIPGGPLSVLLNVASPVTRFLIGA